MDDAVLVCRPERFRDLLEQCERFHHWQDTGSQTLGERLALDQLHHQKPNAIRLVEIVEGRDARMVERGEQLRLSLEPGEKLAVRGQGLRQDFDGNVARQLRVPGAPDFPHSASA